MSEKENETNNEQELQQTPEVAVESSPEAEEKPEVYPLRPASEDPRWALWAVCIWTGIAVFLFLFLTALLILGFWYD